MIERLLNEYGSGYLYAVFVFGAIALIGLILHGWDWIVTKLTNDKEQT